MAKLYFEDYNEKRTFLTEVEIDFESVGTKRLMAKFAGLEIIK